MTVLKQRDHRVGRVSPAGDSSARLLYWLDTVAPVAQGGQTWRQREFVAASLSRVLAFVAGFVAMAGFLLGSRQGLVNVFFLLLVFVLVQLAMSAVSTLALLRTASGFVPAGLPASPARWLVARSLPDQRYLREAGGVLRLLFLRYGQEWGALFTLAALLAFVLIPAFKDFVFVWGSTYAPGDGVVSALVDDLAAPWRGWLSWATVPPEVVAGSRHHDALVLDRAGIDGMRGWWPFLFMCLLVYGLLPRLLLWLAARWYAPRLLRRTFEGLPGVDLVLSRMHSALISTQAREAAERALENNGGGAGSGAINPGEGLLLLDWAGALGGADSGQFEELSALTAQRLLRLGQGALAQDRQLLGERALPDVDHLLVLVKSWEPPVAELADLLSLLPSHLRCTFCLVPLPRRAVPQRKVEDWRGFSRALPFATAEVRVLTRIQSP
ncbi:MAG: DUF2868 domain-containing protein [Parahaliea sp.]